MRARCSVPRSDGWKRTPNCRIHSGQPADRGSTSRASASSVSSPVTRSRSARNSSSGYGVGQHVGRRGVRAAQVAGVPAVAAAEMARRAFEHDDAARPPARAVSAAHSAGVAAAEHGDVVDAALVVIGRPPRSAQPAAEQRRPSAAPPAASSVAQIGRVTNTDRSPSLIASARRNCCSDERAEHQAEHRRHERNVVDAHRAADRADDVEQHEVEHRAVQAVGAERREHEDAAEEQRPRHEHHARPHAASGRFSTSSITLPM